jgi:GDP-L-fucose synthase
MPTNRAVLDVSNPNEVEKILSKHKFDVIIHTAISGGRRNKKDTFSDFLNNLRMFENLINNSDKYGALFNFGSGAEFNRIKGVKNAKESDKTKYMPLDYYGISKNIISNYVENSPENIYNFRLFGCFGKFEKKDRFIKASVNRILRNEEVIIHQNKIMDFISSEDVCRVLDHYLENYDKKTLPKDLNLCYNDKRDLKEIASSIFNFMNEKPNIKILKDGYSSQYTGSSKRLDSLNLELVGFENSLKNTIEQMVKHND